MAANTSTDRLRPTVYEAQDSITRPSDTTQYGVGDCLSDSATSPTSDGYFTLPIKVPKGSGVIFTDFVLHKSDEDVTGADFDILLFDTAPTVSQILDNAACSITDALMLNCKGVVRFVSTAVGAREGWVRHGTGNTQHVAKEFGFVLGASETNVYGVPVLAGTYTPASAEVLTLTAKWRLP